MDPSCYVHVKNISPESDQVTLREEFGQYGTIVRLYYKPGNRFVNIYYSSTEESQAVIQASKHNTWKAELGKSLNQMTGQQFNRPLRDKSPPNPRKSQDYPRGPSKPDSSEKPQHFQGYHNSPHSRDVLINSQDISNTTSVDGEMSADEIADLSSAAKNRRFVNVHGDPITVYKLNSGDMLVRLSEIRKAGFAVYHIDNYSKLKDTDQISHEFYLHLLGEAKTFLINNKVQSVNEAKICEAIEKVKTQLFNSPSSENSSFPDTKKHSTLNCEDSRNSRNYQNQTGFVNSQSRSHDVSNPSRNRISSTSTNEENSTPQNDNFRNNQRGNYRQQNDSPRQQNESPRQRNDNYIHQNNFKHETNGRINSEDEKLKNPLSKGRTFQTTDDNLISINRSVTSSANGSGDQSFLRPPKSFVNRNVENDDFCKISDSAKENSSSQANVNREESRDRFKPVDLVGKPVAASSPQSPALRKPHTSPFAKKEESAEKIVADTPPLKKVETPLKKAEPVKKAEPLNKAEPTYKRVELKDGFQKVTVCHVENPTTCWVCLQSNSDVAESILLDVVDCEPNSKIVDPVKGQLFIAEYDDMWCRAEVLETRPLTVFFIDFGNVSEVKYVKSIPKELAEVPAQAVKIELDDMCGKELEVEMELRIRQLEMRKDGEYLVTMKEKTDCPVKPVEKADSPVKPVKEADSPVKPKKTIPVFHGKPETLKMKNGDMVMIIGENEGKFYVRTRECCMKLKAINEEIKSFIGEPLEDLKAGQMVLATYNNEIRRAVITDLSSRVQVEFIDYPGKETVPREGVRSISESLAQQPATLILTPHLDGVESFKEKSMELIRQTIESKSKLTVELSATSFNLVFPDKETLVTKVKNLDKDPSNDGFITFDDIPYYSAKIGMGQYMFMTVGGADDITMMPADAVDWIAELASITDDGTGPYHPKVLEICIGEYQEAWYRCVVRSIVDDDIYDVLFVEYGNVENVHSSKLRKLPAELARVPILGIPCCIDDVPQGDRNVDSMLKEILADGEVHRVHVKAFTDFKYYISVPDVSDKLIKLGIVTG